MGGRRVKSGRRGREGVGRLGRLWSVMKSKERLCKVNELKAQCLNIVIIEMSPNACLPNLDVAIHLGRYLLWWGSSSCTNRHHPTQLVITQGNDLLCDYHSTIDSSSQCL